MNNRNQLKVLLIIVLLVFALLPVGTVSAATSAKIIIVTGDVQVLRGGGEKPFKAFVNMRLTEGDRIITGTGARADIELDNEDAVITLSENTCIYISELRGTGDSQQTSIALQSGSISNSVKKALTNASRYEVKTPNAAIGVKGTHFLVSIYPATGETAFHVLTGSVGGYIIPPQTPIVSPYISITDGLGYEPSFISAPTPLSMVFSLNASEQMIFNVNDLPESFHQSQFQPEELDWISIDPNFLEQLEELVREQPTLFPPFVLESLEKARQSAFERIQENAGDSSTEPDTGGFVDPVPPYINAPPQIPPPPPPPPFYSGDSGYYPPPPMLPVNNVVITTDPSDVSNLAHDSEVTVTLSTTTDDAIIYYSIDDSLPTKLYEGPFTVTASGMSAETVKVRAFGQKTGFLSSSVSSKEIKFAAPVKIVSVKSVPEDVYFYSGGEYLLDVEVEYRFAHMNQVGISLGLNNEEADQFNLIAEEVVTGASGTFTFENIKTKVQYWEDTPFKIYVNIVDPNDEDKKLLGEDFAVLDVSRPVKVDIIGLIGDGLTPFDDWAKAETTLTYQDDSVNFVGLLHKRAEEEPVEVPYYLEMNNDGTRTLTINNVFFNERFEGIQGEPVTPSQFSFDLLFSVGENNTTISIPFIVDVNFFNITTAQMNPPYDVEFSHGNLDLENYNLSIVRYEDNGSEPGLYLHSSTANSTLDVSQPYPENSPDKWQLSTVTEFTDGTYYIVLHAGEFNQGEIIPANDLIFISRFVLLPNM